VAFVRAPFNLSSVAAAADDFDANIILIDYLQRIGVPGENGDRRGALDAAMGHLRRFADEGVAVVAISAVARQKDRAGSSSYDGERLSLASFRESSELEFGCDDAFIVSPTGKDSEDVKLRHLKSRHSEPRDLKLRFDRRHQCFHVLEGPAQ